MRTLVIALLMVISGCAAKKGPYFSSTETVWIEFDESFEAAQVPTSFGAVSFYEALEKGLRYWDRLGVKMKTLEMMSPSEFDHHESMDKLHVYWKESGASVDTGREFLGMWLTADRCILLNGDYFMNSWWSKCDPSKGVQCDAPELTTAFIADTIAHEVGHSMGLDHVDVRDPGDPNNYEAVMLSETAINVDKTEINKADLKEFMRATKGTD